MTQTKNMMEKINDAFKNQLSNLYQSDIVDTDAEMKVFEGMLKADGYDTSNDFKNKWKASSCCVKIISKRGHVHHVRSLAFWNNFALQYSLLICFNKSKEYRIK